MKIKFKWETIHTATNLNGAGDCITSRAKVIGGWIVNVFTKIDDSISEDLTFVPDRHHEWEIDKE